MLSVNHDQQENDSKLSISQNIWLELVASFSSLIFSLLVLLGAVLTCEIDFPIALQRKLSQNLMGPCPKLHNLPTESILAKFANSA